MFNSLNLQRQINDHLLKALAKAWNKKAKPSNYRIETIPINKTILIVCEGQTEKLYFESFPVLGVKIKAIDLKGQAKLKSAESYYKGF